MRQPRYVLATSFALSLLSWVPAAVAAAGPALAPARPSAGCSRAEIDTGERLERTLDVSGATRSYILQAPPSLKPHHPAPLLLDFHGFGHSAAGVWKVSQFKPLADRDGVITAYPDGLPVQLLGREDRGWEIFNMQGNRDLAFTSRLLEALESQYCVDLNRVYATGFSNGAFLTQILGCTMADRFAAIAIVGGGRTQAECHPSRPLPVLIEHGRRDQRVPIATAQATRDLWLAIDQCTEHASDGCEWHRGCRDGTEVVYCESDIDHQWPPAATERIWSFFRAHPMHPAAAAATPSSGKE